MSRVPVGAIFFVTSKCAGRLMKVVGTSVSCTCNDSGGLEFALKKMEAYRSQALDILFTFPKSEYREALVLMLNYVIERKY